MIDAYYPKRPIIHAFFAYQLCLNNACIRRLSYIMYCYRKRGDKKMRTMVYVQFYYSAKRRHPNAVAIVKVYGGFLAFYDAQDYAIWQAQK